METKQWKLADREGWSAGPWDDEPDKMQWADEATGLPCLIVRGPVGSLCGYVGVGPTHPLYGKHYDGVGADVHGGLTFAHGCSQSEPEDYALWLGAFRGRLAEMRSEASKHPHGDSARCLRRWEPVADDYEKWRELSEGTSICHLGGDFEPAWWFGFDCAHLGDYGPHKRHSFDWREPGATYKTVAYVQAECRSLAEQLAHLGSSPASR